MFDVVFESLGIKLRYGNFAEQNFGITYFMNTAYYDFFKESDIEWAVDLVKRFQNQIFTL